MLFLPHFLPSFLLTPHGTSLTTVPIPPSLPPTLNQSINTILSLLITTTYCRYITGHGLQSLTAVFFPTGAALFAAAASVSKARCEVDAQAASTAATRGLVKKDDKDDESDPNKMVWELLVTTARTSRNFLRARLQTFGNLVRSGTFLRKLRRKA